MAAAGLMATIAEVQRALVGFEELEVLGSEESRLVYRCRIGAELPWLRGHFPELAILPGVAQLHSLVKAAGIAHFGPLGALKSQTRVKFSYPLIVGDQLEITLVRKNERDLSYSISWLGGTGSAPALLGRDAEGAPAPPVIAASGVLHFHA